MAKLKKITFEEVVRDLKLGKILNLYYNSNGVKNGYYISKRYVPANYFEALLEQKAIILKERSKNLTEKYVLSPDIDVNSIKLITVYRYCVICGKKFEKNGSKKTCCKAHQKQLHNLTVKKNESKLSEKRKKEKHQKNIQKAIKKHFNKINKKPSIILSTGCEIINYKTKSLGDNGRCEKYSECQHNEKCLFELPEYWYGFKCINDHVGFKEKKVKLQIWSSDQ